MQVKSLLMGEKALHHYTKALKCAFTHLHAVTLTADFTTLRSYAVLRIVQGCTASALHEAAMSKICVEPCSGALHGSEVLQNRRPAPPQRTAQMTTVRLRKVVVLHDSALDGNAQGL